MALGYVLDEEAEAGGVLAIVDGDRRFEAALLGFAR